MGLFLKMGRPLWPAGAGMLQHFKAMLAQRRKAKEQSRLMILPPHVDLSVIFQRLKSKRPAWDPADVFCSWTNVVEAQSINLGRMPYWFGVRDSAGRYAVGVQAALCWRTLLALKRGKTQPFDTSSRDAVH
jgi:hypothetical protein